MKRSIHSLIGHSIRAIDGEIGKDSPEYNPDLPIGEVYEADLENHYDGFVCHKR